MKTACKQVVVLLLSILCIGCGHTKVNHVGLLSVGDLKSKKIPENTEGPTLIGEDSGYSYYLSEAVRDALKGTQYDTIVDAEVTNKTGLFVWSNQIQVKGKGLNSKNFPKGGVNQ